MIQIFKIAGRAGTFAAKAAGFVLDSVKKIVVYLCLVMVLAASALADRLDPPEKT
ncbi:MAG: hypothetical protein IKE69_12500 [Thermoguttaceae bacterium]|nr:hypothetical protein [Thermoguttaceae bacterium]